MKRTEENKNGVIGVLSLARQVNPEIGNYLEHFINENFRFLVKLTDNGAISMSREISRDYEALPNSITKERIDKVVDTFRSII